VYKVTNIFATSRRDIFLLAFCDSADRVPIEALVSRTNTLSMVVVVSDAAAAGAVSGGGEEELRSGGWVPLSK
jgi:hypothetical protein